MPTVDGSKKPTLKETELRCLSLLKHKDVAIRRDAVSILAEIGTDSIEDLICMLGDPDDKVRATAAKAAGKAGHKQAIPHLLKALQDSYWGVRANAAFALGELDYLGGKDKVLEILGDEEHEFVLYAVDSTFEA